MPGSNNTEVSVRLQGNAANANIPSKEEEFRDLQARGSCTASGFRFIQVAEKQAMNQHGQLALTGEKGLVYILTGLMRKSGSR